MPLWPVSSEKQKELQRLFEKLQMREEDLEEHFVRSSGAGGQKVQKTSTCVVLKHLPSGIEVKCQIQRTQAMNRFLARRILCEKLEEMIFQKESAEEKRREKIRRQKRKRSRRAKEKMLADKHHQSEKKKLRKDPTL